MADLETSLQVFLLTRTLACRSLTTAFTTSDWVTILSSLARSSGFFLSIVRSATSERSRRFPTASEISFLCPSQLRIQRAHVHITTELEEGKRQHARGFCMIYIIYFGRLRDGSAALAMKSRSDAETDCKDIEGMKRPRKHCRSLSD